MRVLVVVALLCLASLAMGNKLFAPYEKAARDIYQQIEHDVDELEEVIREHDSMTFEMWKERHNKAYDNEEEEKKRKNIFEANLRYIKEHNSLGKDFLLGMNQFGDMSHDEYRTTILMQAVPTHKHEGEIYKAPEGFVAEEMVDWRKGEQPLVLEEVKNQGQCGSCWAFAAVGSLEGQWQRKNKNDKMVSLSEQDLVDCSTGFGNMGCNGGLMDNAFSYIKSVGGIDTEDDYGYTAHDGKCHEDDEHRTAKVTGFVDVPSGDETALKNATSSVGPIAVAIDASQISFQFYRTGVYNPFMCSSTQLDHGVVVVGYGSMQGKDYWIVRNSWGSVWGKSGYILMARNKNNKCGIATQASYPLV